MQYFLGIKMAPSVDIISLALNGNCDPYSGFASMEFLKVFSKYISMTMTFTMRLKAKYLNFKKVLKGHNTHHTLISGHMCINCSY